VHTRAAIDRYSCRIPRKEEGRKKEWRRKKEETVGARAGESVEYVLSLVLVISNTSGFVL
jgi:hypothetical protein